MSDNNTDITPYLDKNGLIVEKSGDGGDTANRVGGWCFGRYVTGDGNIYQFKDMLKKLTIAPGVFVRNPDPTMWYSNPLNFSRDQTRPLVMAMGAYGVTDQLKANLWNLIKNFGFYPNLYPNWVKPGDPGYTKKIPDFTSPEYIAEYIRAFFASGNKWMYGLYPLVLLGDLFKLLGTYISVFYVDKDLTQADDMECIMSFIQAYKWMPTPLSWLARKIYSKYRPIIPNGDNASNGANSAMWYYFVRPEADGVPPIYYLYKSTVDKLFK